MAAKKTSVTQVPYAADGSLLHYVRMSAAFSETVDWRPNLPFQACLQIGGMYSGRSAKYLILQPVNSPDDRRTYPMFVSDLLEMIQGYGIDAGGIVCARWMVAKRGENYGLRIARTGE